MTDRKIIFIDVDGTLIDYHGRLPESADYAIKQARKNGHKVYISTGRSEAEVYDYIWDVGLDGMIGGNGSYVRDGDQVVMHQTMTRDQTKRVVDWLDERGLEYYLECNAGLFGSDNFQKRGDPVIDIYSQRKGQGSGRKVKDAFPNMQYGKDMYRDDVNKISFILDSYQDHLDSVEEFPDLKPGTWGGAGEIALFGDLGVKDISKAHAIDELLKHLGADIEDTIAFGDAKIDIPMLDYCNIGVAVASGGDEIKEMADYVTDGVEDDGIYKAFVHFGLIEPRE